MANLKTFIRWPGNKSKHFGKIEEYFPDYDEYDRYVEPFLGSGAVFLKIKPEKWIINDLNKDNINSWKTVRDEPEYLVREITKFGKSFKPMTKKNKEKKCKKIISQIPNEKYNKHRAKNYMLMKDCSFNGLIFKNNEWVFPCLCASITSKNKYFFMSKTKLNNINNVSEFLCENVKKNKIYNRDYKWILNKTKDGDFVFLDPPYIEDHDYTFNYNKDEDLDNEFLEELLEQVCKLDKKGVLWLMTQADTPEVREIFEDYEINEFPVYRVSIHDYVNELVITNY